MKIVSIIVSLVAVSAFANPTAPAAATTTTTTTTHEMATGTPVTSTPAKKATKMEMKKETKKTEEKH